MAGAKEDEQGLERGNEHIDAHVHLVAAQDPRIHIERGDQPLARAHVCALRRFDLLAWLEAHLVRAACAMRWGARACAAL
jgi:hypothetical protein